MTSQTTTTKRTNATAIRSQNTLKFDPSQVFTQETLQDIRDIIGLTEHNMTNQQFANVLDAGMRVTLVLAVADDGFRYIKDGGDMDNCLWCVGGSCHITDGDEFTIRYGLLTSAVQNILIDHITDGADTDLTNAGVFLDYQMTLNEMEWNRRCVQLGVATASYNGVLPSRKQVLDLYHRVHVLAATEENE